MVKAQSEEILRLDQEVTECHQEILKMRKKVQDSIQKTYPLDSLSAQIYNSMFMYIQKQVKKICDQPCYLSKSTLLAQELQMKQTSLFHEA